MLTRDLKESNGKTKPIKWKVKMSYTFKGIPQTRKYQERVWASGLEVKREKTATLAALAGMVSGYRYAEWELMNLVIQVHRFYALASSKCGIVEQKALHSSTHFTNWVTLGKSLSFRNLSSFIWKRQTIIYRRVIFVLKWKDNHTCTTECWFLLYFSFAEESISWA